MHQKIFLILLITSLSASSASALSLSLSQSYAQGETIIAELSGSIFGSLSASDVEFTRGHVQVGSFEYDLKRLGDRYFLYAVAPFAPHNYTLIIHNVETLVNGQQVVIDFMQNFTVTNETAPYTLRPGLIIAGQDFDISFTSHAELPQEISLELAGNTTLTLMPGITTREIEIEEFAYGLHSLSLGRYEFQLYSTYTPPETNDTSSGQPRIIELSPGRFDHRFIRGKEPHIITFTVRNTAERDLSGFKFTYDDKRFELEPSRLRTLKSNETATFNLTVLSEESISDLFTITVGDEEFELPLELFFDEENATTVIGPSSNVSSNGTGFYSCSELNGRVCLTSQQCSGETITTKEGACCRGSCIDVKETTSLAWLGYVIGLIVLLILIIIGGRYLKTRSRMKEDNVLHKQIKKLEKPF